MERENHTKDIFRNVSNSCKEIKLGTYIVYRKGINTVYVSFDPYFNTIIVRDRNLIPTSYWQAMCGFIKINKLVFVHSEQHDPSSTLISPSDQGCTNSENSPEP